MQRTIWIIVPILMFGLAACTPSTGQLPPATTMPPTPSQSPSVTATIVWFPPTATYTRLPETTSRPISTLVPDIPHGSVIFQDNFEEQDLWTVGQLTAGRIGFGVNELSLGISQPKGYLYSLRQNTQLTDFYLEITASPSICRTEDEYGILFRVASTGDFFRFGVNCNGEARLDRVLAGQAAASQAPILSGSIPPGAPNSTRLGIQAIGGEMQFYANSEFLFSISDSSLPAGGVGVFARAAGEEMMSVNFSDLVVYQVQR